jgi:hypothetical protein
MDRNPEQWRIQAMKHSKNERRQREQETERMRQIESAWFASLPRDVAASFALQGQAARTRAPQPRPADMAPGTAPNPPRPGREPRPPKEPQRSSRRFG